MNDSATPGSGRSHRWPVVTVVALSLLAWIGSALWVPFQPFLVAENGERFPHSLEEPTYKWAWERSVEDWTSLPAEQRVASGNWGTFNGRVIAGERDVVVVRQWVPAQLLVIFVGAVLSIAVRSDSRRRRRASPPLAPFPYGYRRFQAALAVLLATGACTLAVTWVPKGTYYNYTSTEGEDGYVYRVASQTYRPLGDPVVWGWVWDDFRYSWRDGPGLRVVPKGGTAYWEIRPLWSYVAVSIGIVLALFGAWTAMLCWSARRWPVVPVGEAPA